MSRLEEIKRQRQKKSTALDYIDLDIDWLIQQAERAQELEKENEKLNGEADGLLQKLEDNEPYYSMRCIELERKNKRYEEALEFYANVRNYEEYDNRKLGLVMDVVEDAGEKARKALKGESE